MSTYILGVSAWYHDSAAALLRDGLIVAAAQEERFTRRKHDPAFPSNAIAYCLRAAGIGLSDVQYVVFYDKPLLKFERLLETFLASAPRGVGAWINAVPLWAKEKLFQKQLLRKELAALGDGDIAAVPKLLFTDHHQAHAASAFFPSPFPTAGVLCLDGVGEWATTSVWLGKNQELTAQWQLDFPHSLGLLYSAFTYYCGFRVNSGEYKLMGLAPYGQPRYVNTIREHLIDLKPDGSFRLNMAYFDYAVGTRMTNAAFDALFGGPARTPESPMEQRHMDLARSIQAVTEEVVLNLARSIQTEFGVTHLCLAGGVALNCVANGRLKREGGFEGLWIQPAAGDAGGALGAALSAWHTYMDRPRVIRAHALGPPGDPAVTAFAGPTDAMRGAALGPSFDDAEILDDLAAFDAVHERLEDDALYPRLAEILAAGHVVGWMSGRMEFGPRSLGHRSILGDPRNREMQTTMNLKIKYRESFRPFAPAVLEERVADYFEFDGESPYMLLTAQVHADHLLPLTEAQQALTGLDLLKAPRATIPAVTHVDNSARLQTVDETRNPRFHALLQAFDALTGCPVLVNTSFNVRGEPIVCSPADAYRCFMRTEIDYLVVENFLLAKTDQPAWPRDDAWKASLELD